MMERLLGRICTLLIRQIRPPGAFAHFGAEFLLARYPNMLRAHFKLEWLPSSPAELLEAIGRKRGCLVRGGMVDTHKAADALVHGFRSGALGRITLETPDSPTLAPARPVRAGA